MKYVLDSERSTELIKELLEEYGFRCTEVPFGQGGIFYTVNGERKKFTENIFVKRIEKYEPTVEGRYGTVLMSTILLSDTHSDEYETESELSEIATDCIDSILYPSEPKMVEISNLRENDEFEVAPDNNLTAA